jgi:glycosyltransferase XagB
LFAWGADWDWIAADYGSAAETATPRSLNDLPLLSQAALVAALRRLDADELQVLLTDRVLLLDEPGHCAICGPRGYAIAIAASHDIVARIPVAEFHQFIGEVWGDELRQAATHGLAQGEPEFSARARLSPGQSMCGLVLIAALMAACLVLPFKFLALAMSLLGVAFFLSILAVKLLALMPPPRGPSRANPIPDDELPFYSVLVPLFRETAVLPQLLGALSAIDYPRDRLDVKIVVEEGDDGMQQALRQWRLPSWIEVIVVPEGLPRTKPRALNFALQFAWGQLVTIYDAEDIPMRGQLKDCAAIFADASPRLACLQAELRVYNADENWLARQFALEYAALFSRIVPALTASCLPVALGGTSNHFRITALRLAGAWDPFNVTEDADLGMRLARRGYDVGIVDSHTLEEACVSFANWRRQRARWLKGFLHTWLVHMRHPARTIKELGLAGFWILQASTFGTFLSALLHPFLTLAAAYHFAFTPGSDAWDQALRGLYVAVMLLGYGTGLALTASAMRRRGLMSLWPSLLTMPVYWMLMSAAAIQALWQFIFDPHGWNKTVHGRSRFTRSMAASAGGAGGRPLHERQHQDDAEE